MKVAKGKGVSLYSPHAFRVSEGRWLFAKNL